METNETLGNTTSRIVFDITADKLLRRLTESGNVVPVSLQFRTIKTNAQRVSFLYWLLNKYSLLPALVPDVKNNRLATDLRQEGNELYKRKKISDAVVSYTKSIALAEDGSKEMALGYANRSAAMYEMGLYAECLTEINRALENGYPDHLKPKLLKRKESANELKSKQVIREYFQPVPEIPKNRRNKSIESASDCIEIRYTEDQGRHVVATRDISPGEILVVEKAFCHTPMDDLYTHCHECLILCYNSLPCAGCTQTFYCSEECRGRAAAYHQYECKILATIKNLKIVRKQLIPLKIAILIKGQYSKIKEFDSPAFNLEQEYRSDRYKEIHNFLAHTSERTAADLFGRSTISAVMYHLIKNYTDFFGGTEEETVFNELVMLHMQTVACSAFSISQQAEKEGKFVGDKVGVGLYSFSNMLNHSCSSNTVEVDYGTVMVTRALETIRKGQQCNKCYGYPYFIVPKKLRRAELRRQYLFDCCCDACQQDWPLYQNLPDLELQLWLHCVRSTTYSKLCKGDLATAKKLLSKMLPQLKELEKVRLTPNKTLFDFQSVIEKCYHLLGNVKRL